MLGASLIFRAFSEPHSLMTSKVEIAQHLSRVSDKATFIVLVTGKTCLLLPSSDASDRDTGKLKITHTPGQLD